MRRQKMSSVNLNAQLWERGQGKGEKTKAQEERLHIVQVVLTPGAYMGTTLTWRAEPETHANVITRAGLDWDGRIWLNIIAKNLFQMAQRFWRSRKEGFKTSPEPFQGKWERKRRWVFLWEPLKFATQRERDENAISIFKSGDWFLHALAKQGGFTGR